jgi:hypothetical protein
MGQYHKVVNLDKKQFLHPHKFGDGLKLREFGCSGEGTLTALTALLAAHNGRGGGDFRSDSPLIGSWAGDRIAIVGDYGDAEGDDPRFNVYGETSEGGEFEDISDAIKAALPDDISRGEF